MGSLVGHVAPGLGFLLIGLWHFFNHTKLHLIYPSTYTSLPWFPTKPIKYLELNIIALGSAASISMELFISPNYHQPLDPSDLTIPSNHLHNFEHSSISLSFLVYSLFAIALDRQINPGPANAALTYLAAAMAFTQELLMFHLHSTDHMGAEGQYHLLLQSVILVSLASTLLGIVCPKSFVVSFVRSASLVFQGVWFVIMGWVLWTPSLVFKGCFINLEDGRSVVRCHGREWLERAKSLVNIQFSWVLVGVTVFSLGLYLILSRVYQVEEYRFLDKNGGGGDDDLESPENVQELKRLMHLELKR
ncbi:hypothetical protein QJS04_geneDACA017171 [Acorus gramineus]|uniref:Uncharacterized protein n=1 Tax=Acorus gramineus TaxID=55184 RepID=A0AAV9BLV7_ACOGR|nr:hypothetical protein QJS04_geneDACA017171 [Acorus gramineus]